MIDFTLQDDFTLIFGFRFKSVEDGSADQQVREGANDKR